MEGVTDWPARLWFGQTSAPEFMWTPFLRVTDTFPGRELPRFWCPELARGVLPAANSGVIPQLMATNADDFARVAEQVLTTGGYESVDLNCGCPSPVVVGGRAGSALLQHPEELGEMLRAVTGRLGPGRVSVKVRTGFAAASEFPAILDVLRELPLRQVAVHGRTRPDRYLGRARYDLVEMAARRLEGIPVIGSGDICDFATAEVARQETPGVSKWIIGRGALRNPWIFEELRSGNPVTIPVETILCAIECFAWLHELYWNDGERLLRLWGDGVFEASAGLDPDRWRRLLDRVAVRGAVPGRRACSRTKMIWNYLRSSLPPGMRDGSVLRGNTIEGLVGAVSGLAMALQVIEFTTFYDPSWDWVYNGSGRAIQAKVSG